MHAPSSSSRLCFLHQYSLFSLCQRTVTQDFISYLFFFLIAVPDALKFLQSIGQFLFGNRERPACARFVMVCVFNADVLLYIVRLWGSHCCFKNLNLCLTQMSCCIALYNMSTFLTNF